MPAVSVPVCVHADGVPVFVHACLCMPVCMC